MKHAVVVTYSDHITKYHGDFATPMLAAEWGAAYTRYFNEHQISGPTVTNTTVVPLHDPFTIAKETLR